MKLLYNMFLIVMALTILGTWGKEEFSLKEKLTDYQASYTQRLKEDRVRSFLEHHDERRRQRLEEMIHEHRRRLGDDGASPTTYDRRLSQYERTLDSMTMETDDEKLERHHELYQAMIDTTSPVDYLDFDET